MEVHPPFVPLSRATAGYRVALLACPALRAYPLMDCSQPSSLPAAEQTHRPNRQDKPSPNPSPDAPLLRRTAPCS